MNIVELRVEGFQRLSAITIRPDGSLVRIEGPNGAGKSSVLDAIMVAMRGREVAPPQPINKNSEEAIIRLDIGDYKLTRTFKRTKAGEYTTDLKLVAADGSRITTKPQGVLNSLLGDLSFDPLAFMEAKPDQQLEQLKKLVPGIDFAALEKQRKDLFEQRTDINRRAHAAKARAEAVALPPGKKPERVDVAATLDEIEKAQRSNEARADDITSRARCEADIEKWEAEAEDLRARAASLEKKAEELRAKMEKWEPLPAPIDVTPLKARVAQAQEIDRKIALFEQRKAAEDEAVRLTEQAEDLTESITAIDATKQKAIAAANLPVPGLAFGDGMVLLDDLPLQQANTAMQLRISIALAGALNPQLRVILVREGSLLDKAHLAALAAYAEEKGLQVWVERVQDEKGSGIWITDGTVEE